MQGRGREDGPRVPAPLLGGRNEKTRKCGRREPVGEARRLVWGGSPRRRGDAPSLRCFRSEKIREKMPRPGWKNSGGQGGRRGGARGPRRKPRSPRRRCASSSKRTTRWTTASATCLSSDDAELYRACPDNGRTPVADLRLAFPFGPKHFGTKSERLDDYHTAPAAFRLGACLVHCCAEPDDDENPKSFRPALYCAWPRSIVDALKLGTRARADVQKATARLAKALRDAHKRRPPYDVYVHAPPPPPTDPGPAPPEKAPAWGPPRGDSALLAKPPPKKSLPGPRPAQPPKPSNGQQRPLLERLTSDAGRMQRLPSDPVPGSDPRRRRRRQDARAARTKRAHARRGPGIRREAVHARLHRARRRRAGHLLHDARRGGQRARSRHARDVRAVAQRPGPARLVR